MKDLEEVRAAYQRGRRQDLLEVTLLSLAVVSVALCFAEWRWSSLIAAGLAVVLSRVMCEFSWLSSRRVLVSLFLGILPLAAALLSKEMGHSCGPQGCSSLCTPFCAMGGLASGVLLSRIALTSERPFFYWITSAAIVSVTGAIGCSCVGMSGTFAMMAGLGVSSLLVPLGKWRSSL